MVTLDMTSEDAHLLESILGRMAGGSAEAAIAQALELEKAHLGSGHFLLALELWKRILDKDPQCVQAHLKLIALQERLELAADVQVQRRMLEQALRLQGISPERLEQMRAELGLGEPGERPGATSVSKEESP